MLQEIGWPRRMFHDIISEIVVNWSHCICSVIIISSILLFFDCVIVSLSTFFKESFKSLNVQLQTCLVLVFLHFQKLFLSCNAAQIYEASIFIISLIKRFINSWSGQTVISVDSRCWDNFIKFEILLFVGACSSLFLIKNFLRQVRQLH